VVFRRGLDLASDFYTEVVRPALDLALAGAPHSAGLLGWGSEVQGFETPRSTDHAWGPRLQVFLGPKVYAERHRDLDRRLDEILPETFAGFPIRFVFPDGAAPRHWVTISDVATYFGDYLGVTTPDELSTRVWLSVPTQSLRELTGGAVFHDGLGVLEQWRACLAWYPDDVWRYVLASQWMRLDHEEPFVGRCGEVGDELGSAIVAARQVRDLMRLALLMSRVYPPYSKWLGTAFGTVPISRHLAPHLTAVLRATSWRERERHLVPAYELLAREQNRLGLSEPVEPTVRRFHSRPFLVLDSHRLADALVESINDPQLRQLPLVGAIDQYVDSTCLLDRTAARLRRTYISGPA
jgi:Domain of unknown function (DUF4037)